MPTGSKEGDEGAFPRNKNYFLYLFMMIESSFIDDYLSFLISHLCFLFSINRVHLPPKRKQNRWGGDIETRCLRNPLVPTGSKEDDEGALPQEKKTTSCIYS